VAWLHGQNPPPWVENLDFVLVRAGGLCLCSSELYSPKTFQTSSKILFIVPMGLTLSLGLHNCGLNPQKMKENAEKEGQIFVQRLGFTLISCTGNDSDRNNYVSCTFKDKNGQLVEGECAYDPSVNTGCKLKNSYNYQPLPSPETPQ
jgi:hypothetical protein